MQAVEQITANDVPMDGSVAIFPKQDMSEIYTKSWNADGTIRTVVYKPYTASKPDVANSSADMSKMKMGLSDEATEAFMARFDSLEKKFDELMPKIVFLLSPRNRYGSIFLYSFIAMEIMRNSMFSCFFYPFAFSY